MDTPLTIALVLRSGGIYKPIHVKALQAQLGQWAPWADLVCFTDMDVRGMPVKPLMHMWPSWWSKMEIFAPGVRGDILYMDLDTLVVGPLDDIANVERLTMLRDFYRDGIYKGRPEGLGSGLMYLPESDRALVWDAFIRDPQAAMTTHYRGGDQGFLEQHYLARAARWQDVCPGQIASLKVHCSNGVPSTTRVICAHGKPKFWQLPEYKHLYEH